MTHMDETKVLAVDDEADLVDLYAEFLSPEYGVRTATSGTDALEKIDATVDVVLLDRRMPDMSGREVLRVLRERGHDCQVAMLTAVDPEQDILEMPFDDYRTKPVTRRELIELVENLIDRTTYDEQNRELFQLASKRAALEVAGNDDTAEYRELVERIETLRSDIRTAQDEIGTKAAFKELLAD